MFVAPGGPALPLHRPGKPAAEAAFARGHLSHVGIPFCPTRCAYCSFVSASVEKTFSMMEPYVDALIGEISLMGESVRRLGLRIKSVYMGGGTPTTLPAPLMARLLNALETHFDLSSLAEYTVEAGRPDTVTAEKLAVLKAHGVSRVSINPQTMEDRVLQAIGRRHTAADVLRAMDIAQKSGIPHINMDLIAGLPEDTAAGFRRRWTLPFPGAGQPHRSYPGAEKGFAHPAGRPGRSAGGSRGGNAGLRRRAPDRRGLRALLPLPPEIYVRQF